MLERFKAFWQGVVLAPVVNLLLRLGVSPDAVTLVGTLVITAFVFSDMIDGAMARKSGRSSTFGSFFDSTLDRIGDAAIFGGLVLFFAGPGDDFLYLCLSLYCLVMGAVTSYARAKAESLGLKAEGGIAERADRTVAILVAIGVSDWWNLPILLDITLWALAVAITITVLQRMWMVRKQTLAPLPEA